GPVTPVAVALGQPVQIVINVPFAAGFTGAVTVTPPVLAGITFAPSSVTLTQSGPATFTATASGPVVNPAVKKSDAAVAVNANFTVAQGNFITSLPVTLDLVPAFDFNLAVGPFTLARSGNFN